MRKLILTSLLSLIALASPAQQVIYIPAGGGGAGLSSDMTQDCTDLGTGDTMQVYQSSSGNGSASGGECIHDGVGNFQEVYFLWDEAATSTTHQYIKFQWADATTLDATDTQESDVVWVWGCDGAGTPDAVGDCYVLRLRYRNGTQAGYWSRVDDFATSEWEIPLATDCSCTVDDIADTNWFCADWKDETPSAGEQQVRYTIQASECDDDPDNVTWDCTCDTSQSTADGTQLSGAGHTGVELINYDNGPAARVDNLEFFE